jgi:hypothetical protein
LSTDQAVRLRIGDPGQIISANKEAPRATAILEVSKGKPYPVYMHYNQDSSDSGSVSLRWRINGREVSHIPAEFLRHSEKEKYRMDTAGR